MPKTTFSFTIERTGVLDILAESALAAVMTVAEVLTAPSGKPTREERPTERSAERRGDPIDARRNYGERRLDAFLDSAFAEFMRFLWERNMQAQSGRVAPTDPCPVDSPLGPHSREECGHIPVPEPRPSPAVPAESAPIPP